MVVKFFYRKQNKNPAYDDYHRSGKLRYEHHKYAVILFNMRMAADVVFTVAVVAFAAGAVTEFQIRMAYVSSAAYGAAVIIVGFGFCLRGGFELNDLMALGNGFLHLLAYLDTQGKGKKIHHVRAEEQEVVGQRNDGEQIAGEGKQQEVNQNQNQIKQAEEPCLNGNNEEQQKGHIGIGSRKCKKQRKVQVIGAECRAKISAEHITA